MGYRKIELGRYDFAGYGAFVMYSVCSLSIPLMIVAIGKSLNFPMDDGGMAAGGVLHMIRSVAMMTTLLSCGWISAWFGKRITMGASIIMIGLGMLCCALAPAYWVLIPCLLLAGLGEGISEGLLTPFVQDLHPDSPERYVNIAHSFWSVGIVIAVLVAGGLLTLGVHWRIILGIFGILTLLTSLGFLWKENPREPYPESSAVSDWQDVLRCTGKIVKVPRFWRCCLAMFFGAGAEFGLTFWAAAYIELTFNTGAWIAGLGVGMIALGMFTGRTLFGYFAKPHYLRYILLYAAAATIPLTLILAFLRPGLMAPAMLFTLLFILLFASGIGIAPYWPTMQVYGVSNMPELDSTLLYVYFSAMGIPGCGFFAWFMGFIGDRYGLSGAVMVVPACLVIFIAILLWECWFCARKPVSVPAE
ncbi:MAG: MFS transporter [Lentisphaeria bacterium]|nr:MFS transporter [Lentisphaeria bacterium]